MGMVINSDSIDAARDAVIPGRKKTRKKSLVLGIVGYYYSSITRIGLLICCHSTGTTQEKEVLRVQDRRSFLS
jgi:hypothetical protein